MTPVIRVRAVAGRKTNNVALCGNPQTQNRAICVRKIGSDLINLQNLAIIETGGSQLFNIIFRARRRVRT